MPASDEIRIAFFADTHLGFDHPVDPRVERRRRGEDFFRNFQRVLDYAAQTKPDLVVHGGDVFFRSRVSPKIVELLYGELLKFSENNIPLFIVPGNHERSSLPASLWISAESIHVYDKPRTFSFEVRGIKIMLSGFPFVREDIGQRFNNILEDTGWQHQPAAIRLLCMHQTVEGAQVGPADYTFRAGSDVVKMADIPEGFTAILSGHIHRKQVLWRPRREDDLPVIYPGSTERTSFAEKDEPKGFFDIRIVRDERDIWSVRRMDFVELPSRPMVDFEIGTAVKDYGLEGYFREKIADMDADSVVRLKCAHDVEPSITGLVTAPFLRSVFPSSMNVQVTADFYHSPLDGPPRSRHADRKS